MTAMPLTYPGLRPQAARLSTLRKPFQPLDPGIIDASIPTFFVGRDPDGFWLARDAGGENGGLFLLKGSALAFARRASRPLGCAIVLLSEQFELDLENQGNPFIEYLRLLLRRLNLADRDAGR